MHKLYVCDTVQPGDTVAHLALRLTADARNRHQPSFHIIDSATSRIVSKAEYDRILPGWRACIDTGMMRSGAVPLINQTLPSIRPRPIQTGPHERLTVIRYLSWVASLLFAASLTWEVMKRYSDKRRAILDSMRRFGDTFIREFERPLMRQPFVDHPIRSQLRFAPHQGRLKICLAPNDGRNYPNLSDHRKNLEYDVERFCSGWEMSRFPAVNLTRTGHGWSITFYLKAGLKEGRSGSEYSYAEFGWRRWKYFTIRQNVVSPGPGRTQKTDPRYGGNDSDEPSPPGFWTPTSSPYPTCQTRNGC